MNTEKAIDLLDNLIGMVEDNQDNDYDAAFRMAIDALKAQADGDTVSRQDVITLVENIENRRLMGEIDLTYAPMLKGVKALPPSPSRPQIIYSKAGYIMSLHKEYGCTLTRAEEAHNKALEYLRDKAMMKG